MVQQHMHWTFGYSDGRVFDKMKRAHMNTGVKTNTSHFYDKDLQILRLSGKFGFKV
jgi:hypothetical protein